VQLSATKRNQAQLARGDTNGQGTGAAQEAKESPRMGTAQAQAKGPSRVERRGSRAGRPRPNDESAGHEGGQRRGAGIAAKERFFAFTR
jgi:hypothetical protein